MERLKNLRYLLVVIGILIIYGIDLLSPNISPYYLQIIIFSGINIILAVSLNVINGLCGQFSLGHAGFMAVGAYFSSFLTFYYRIPFPIALILGGILAGIVGLGVGIPTLRLRGDYLAIATLGMGEIIRVILFNLDIVGGARGFPGIPKYTNFFWVYLAVAVVLISSYNLLRSPQGRAILSIREDEIASEAMGVDTTRFKIFAFIFGSFWAGVAGGLWAHYLQFLHPSSFTFMKSVEVLVMVVLGGLGNISGAAVSAVFLTFLPEALRYIKVIFNTTVDPRMVIYSLILILTMLLRPQGLLGGYRRKVKVQ
ncbi:MAG TPA: branched-chain amino acid ABC transporter permease [bacterium]|jgi:branched-chain amino acid transport system permease protein|nr:branched-chain amino acid ABC transporter permease [Dictyoglomota bacterium]HHV80420.1 branched-chain amino acid ABC transporter permease [bacterium]HOL54718.1 branched-chain amino acid ABC transporter permease [bacterium]HOP55618.1 branched-chain amino acid ABC transporter permease [bacterium]HPO82627.1 branched-chain amino acid ABC transporter permease [bacterium]